MLHRNPATSIKDRDFAYMMQDLISDGGRWNMLVYLIKTYGIVPKKIMRETYPSDNSSKMNKIIQENVKHTIQKRFPSDSKSWIDV